MIIISISEEMSSIYFPFFKKLFPGAAPGEIFYFMGLKIARERWPEVSLPSSMEAVPKL